MVSPWVEVPSTVPKVPSSSPKVPSTVSEIPSSLLKLPSTLLELPSLLLTYAKASPWVVCCHWKAAGLGARTYCSR